MLLVPSPPRDAAAAPHAVEAAVATPEALKEIMQKLSGIWVEEANEKQSPNVLGEKDPGHAIQKLLEGLRTPARLTTIIGDVLKQGITGPSNFKTAMIDEAQRLEGCLPAGCAHVREIASNTKTLLEYADNTQSSRIMPLLRDMSTIISKHENSIKYSVNNKKRSTLH